MPWGDGTGPLGLGPMTGRGLGYCAGFRVPGFLNPLNRFYGGLGMAWRRGFGWGFGRGWGRGFGRGFGWRRAYWANYPGNYPYPPPPPYAPYEPTREELEAELQYLKQAKDDLERRIQELNEEIEKLKQS